MFLKENLHRRARNFSLQSSSCRYKLQLGSLSCLRRFYCLAGFCAVRGEQIVAASPTPPPPPPAPPSIVNSPSSRPSLVLCVYCLPAPARSHWLGRPLPGDGGSRVYFCRLASGGWGGQALILMFRGGRVSSCGRQEKKINKNCCYFKSNRRIKKVE